MLTTALRCNYWPKAPDAVGMQAALRSNCHREVGHLPCCQAQVQRRTPTLLAHSAGCVPGRPICRPASCPQHRYHAPFSAARQRQERMTITAAAQPVRAAAASDAHPDILSVVYDEQQLAEAVTTLGRWDHALDDHVLVGMSRTDLHAVRQEPHALHNIQHSTHCCEFCPPGSWQRSMQTGSRCCSGCVLLLHADDDLGDAA